MRFWKHSPYDGLMLLPTTLQTAIFVWLACTWDERSWLQIGLLAPVALFLAWHNPIMTTHNFIHLPWFAWKPLNRLYSAVNSINLCMPQILYRYQHMNHHRFGNDRIGEDGKTQDYSSTYADGKAGRHEHVIPYCTLALFKPRTSTALWEALAKEPGQYWFEQAVCLTGVTCYLLLSWKFFLVFYLPVVYLGWCLAHMENYYEHYGANPDNRYTDSVSHYGRWYNFFFFNEGYHQEHHLRPQGHWLERPKVREEFQGQLDTAPRHVSGYPPMLAFLERRLKSSLRAPATTDHSVRSET